MAKKKGNRVTIALKCSECNRRNYLTERNKVNTEEKITPLKYCGQCKKRTTHKEEKKMK